jgi:hypothetical protein
MISHADKINFPVIYRIVAGIVFVITLITYSLTVAQTVHRKFWNKLKLIPYKKASALIDLSLK